MRKTTVAIAAGLCLLPAFSSAQNVSKEAGAYERKSVTYVNALWLMDESVRGLHPHQVAFVLDKVKQAISMPRFDYNPFPIPCCAILRRRPTPCGIRMSTKPLPRPAEPTPCSTALRR